MANDRLKFKHEIRDPIHGLIRLTDLEREIIDTSVFQRLRRIKQLALACYVFPGATHTRFEHSLGTLNVAGRIVEHLRNKRDIDFSADAEQTIRLAGLLHDIGHGPFSHVAEDVLQHYYPGNEQKSEIHEEISRRIVSHDSEIVAVLGTTLAEEVAKQLETDSAGSLEHDIVSGAIDSDKMDYLLRDSYYAGVKYGLFDLDRLVDVLDPKLTQQVSRLAVNPEGVETVEQFIVAKYFITQQVYQHRIRRITDLMLVKSLETCIEDGIDEVKKGLIYSEEDPYLDDYLRLDDASVIRALDSAYATTENHYSLLSRRKLLKEVLCKSSRLVCPGKSIESTEKLSLLEKGETSELEGIISRELKTNQAFTHVSHFSMRNPAPKRADNFFDQDAILLRIGDSDTATIADRSVLFEGLSAKSRENRISVFLHVDDCHAVDRDYLVNSLEGVLREYLGGQS